MSGSAEGRELPGTGATKRHVVIALARNNPGVLNRVTSLFRARNFNIESLAAGRTEQPGISRMTIVLRGDDQGLEQVVKQLYRLIDIVRVEEASSEPAVEREMAIVKVAASDRNRSEVLSIAEMNGGRVLDVSKKSIVLEMTGTEESIDALITVLGHFGILELVRTGVLAVRRSSSVKA